MNNLFQEDLAQVVLRLREALLITQETCQRWLQLLADGFVAFVAARGIVYNLYIISFLVLSLWLETCQRWLQLLAFSPS